MPKTSANKNLHSAKAGKNDEFYTQLGDIEKELKHYKDHFQGKVVLCNCDDPRMSNFFKYFSMNFKELGLKKLIATCYKSQERDLFSKFDSEKAIYQIFDGFNEGENIPNVDRIGVFNFEGDGDFRSPECIELLKQADIVVTNPPFSLFREFVSQLVEYDKKFLIIGNKNAITYKETFGFIMNNKMWAGNTPMGTDMLFDIPEDSAKEMVHNKKEGSGYKIIDGVVKGRAQAAWFTNMDFKERHKDLVLVKKYNETEFPKYDNYDAINIDKTKDIPMDYFGAMGVPITFLDQYNPDQFEIIGCSYAYGEPLGYHIKNKGFNVSIAGKEVYKRLFIKNKKVQSN